MTIYARGSSPTKQSIQSVKDTGMGEGRFTEIFRLVLDRMGWCNVKINNNDTHTDYYERAMMMNEVALPIGSDRALANSSICPLSVVLMGSSMKKIWRELERNLEVARAHIRKYGTCIHPIEFFYSNGIQSPLYVSPGHWHHPYDAVAEVSPGDLTPVYVPLLPWL